jgi:transcriptional regulator with XRE-family HTH domain
MNDFLKRVLEELDFLNASKADIARFLNVRKSTVYSWFERDTIPAADTALKIADFLNVSLEYLVTGKKDESKKSKAELSDFEKELLKESAGLLQEDKVELLAYIAMKKSMYRALKGDNGKIAIVKDC